MGQGSQCNWIVKFATVPVSNCPLLVFCISGQVRERFQSTSSADRRFEGVFLFNVLQVNICTSLVFSKPVHIAVVKQQMICFDGETQKYASTYVFKNTVFTSGASKSEEFSLCYLRLQKSVLSQHS